MKKHSLWKVLNYIGLGACFVVMTVCGLIIYDTFFNSDPAEKSLAEQLATEANVIKTLVPNVMFDEQVVNGTKVINFYVCDSQGNPIASLETPLKQERQAILDKADSQHRTHLVYYQPQADYPNVQHYRLRHIMFERQEQQYNKQDVPVDDTIWLDKEGQSIHLLQAFSQDTYREKDVKDIIYAHLPVALVRTDLTDDLLNGSKFAFDDTHMLITISGHQVKVPLEEILGYLREDMISTQQQIAYQAAREKLLAAQTTPQPSPDHETTLPEDPNGRRIALTFDDGPHPEHTKRALEILKKHNVKATFFVLGLEIDGNEELLRQIVADGHEIGNHSFKHPAFTKLSAEQIKEEVNRTQELLYQATGVYPKFLRPPYGATNASVSQVTQMAHAMWNVDSMDWKVRDAHVVSQNILRDVKPGAVVLMHDIHKTSVDSLDLFIPKLKAQGYEFVTMTEMYGASSVKPMYNYYGQYDVQSAN